MSDDKDFDLNIDSMPSLPFDTSRTDNQGAYASVGVNQRLWVVLKQCICHPWVLNPNYWDRLAYELVINLITLTTMPRVLSNVPVELLYIGINTSLLSELILFLDGFLVYLMTCMCWHPRKWRPTVAYSTMITSMVHLGIKYFDPVIKRNQTRRKRVNHMLHILCLWRHQARERGGIPLKPLTLICLKKRVLRTRQI